MKSLQIAFRRLFKKGEHALVRILSLTLGLVFGILLLMESLYYFSFDSFYPDAHRIYVVYENYKMDKSSERIEAYSRVSGAIAPGLKAEVPGIEAATRLNSLGSSIFYTEDKKSISGRFSLADEYLFDVLPRPIISGNPKEILSTPMNCMVSSRVAEAMGGNAMGQVIEMKEYPGRKLTIAGVFETLPENTNYGYDILISMVSIGNFMWDGTENWLGNDRYYACVKLQEGITPQSLGPAIRKMQEKHQDIEKLEEAHGGMVLKYTLEPIQKIFSKATMDIILIVSILALAVIFVSLLNYILLTLNALVNRAKTSAIYKCFGAQTKNLQLMISFETLIVFSISLLLAILLIYELKPIAEAQLGHKLSSAMNPYVVYPLSILMILFLFIVSYFPARFFSRIPVAVAFRNYRHKGNRWKLGLLFSQFIGSSFILTVLVIVSLQYGKMRNADHGYRAQGVYYGLTTGMEGSKILPLINELRSMPQVERVGIGCTTPIMGASGNNVLSPDGERELFNIADYYWIDENYLSILGMPVTEGQTFTDGSTTNDLLISRRGAEMLKLHNGWDDGVVGKQIEVTEHNANGASTICGVFPDFINNSITNPDNRPVVFFYQSQEKFVRLREQSPSFSFYIFIKTHDNVRRSMAQEFTDVFNTFLPQGDALVMNLAERQHYMYGPERVLRNAMIAGSIVILIITIIGLLGYTSSEIIRRRKELAIRKINGASVQNLLRMFIKDLEYVAIPAVTLGLIGAWFLLDLWMQNFAIKVPLAWWVFALCGIFLLALIAFIAGINYIKTANRNPIEELRNE